MTHIIEKPKTLKPNSSFNSLGRPDTTIWELIETIKTNEQTEEIRHQKNQILVYEGHYAPGIFLILDGKILFSSNELREKHTMTIAHSQQEDQEQKEMPPFCLFPEIKLLELRSPYTLTFLTTARSLFIPRTLMFNAKEREILHTLSQIQTRNKARQR